MTERIYNTELTYGRVVEATDVVKTVAAQWENQTDVPLVLMDQGGQRMDVMHGKTGTLRAQMGGHQPIVMYPKPTVYDMTHANHVIRTEDGIVQCLQARMGTGGNQIPLITTKGGEAMTEPIYTLRGNAIGRNGENPETGGHGKDWSDDDACYTLTSVDRHAVVAPQKAFALDAEASNSMKSSNPNSGCREVDQSKTLDTKCLAPGCAQGGIAVVAPTLTCKGNAAMHGIDQENQVAAVVEAQKVLAPTLTASNDPSRSPQSSEVTNQIGAVLKAQFCDVYNGSVQEDGPSATMTAGTGVGAGSSGPSVLERMQVRRFTPTECERLQGFPDGYTRIPYRGKAEAACPDAPRYKAIGNSWAVPCVAWIGYRLDVAMKYSEL